MDQEGGVRLIPHHSSDDAYKQIDNPTNKTCRHRLTDPAFSAFGPRGDRFIPH